MTTLIIAILCAYRLTQVIVLDDISHPTLSWIAQRSLYMSDLFNCAHCSGFWCGVFTAVLVVTKEYAGVWPSHVANFLLWAFAVAGAVSIIEHATGWLTEDEGG